MAAVPREAVLLGGFAVTGVSRADQQSIVTGGFGLRILVRLALAFGAAVRRLDFAAASRRFDFHAAARRFAFVRASR